MRNFLLFTLALAAVLYLNIKLVHAAAPPAGTLVKASGQAVYYLNLSGKRLVFPTEKTFKTWYPDFSSVVTITDAELAALPLGGNVTYKPGVKLVKITTDPKVYAVSAGGTLRHLASETIAASLYGPDWSSKVDDVPDAFFTNYKTGSAINAVADFTPSEATASATSIDADKGTVIVPPPVCTTGCTTTTSTPPVTPPVVTTTQAIIDFTLSKTAVHVNDTETLHVTASYPKGIRQIKLFFDNQLVTACDFTTNCTGDYYLPAVLGKTTYEAKTIVSTIDLKEFSKVISVPVSTGSDASPDVSIIVDRAVIRPGQMTGITVQAADTIDVKNITIYLNGDARKGCDYQGRQCKWSETLNGAIGTVFTAYGLVTDKLGRTYRTADKTITLAANDVPQVDITSGMTPVVVGNTLMVTVTASDENGIQWSRLLDSQHNVLKECIGAVPCTLTTGPWTQKGQVTLYGKAQDLLGAESEQPFIFQVQ